MGLLTKDAREREDKKEEMEQNQTSVTGGKGKRQTRVSGDALKTRMKSGNLPIK